MCAGLHAPGTAYAVPGLVDYLLRRRFGFRILAPNTAEGASFKKYRCPDAGAVIQRVSLKGGNQNVRGGFRMGTRFRIS